jgi:predicted site-specific integrase-resolvase
MQELHGTKKGEPQTMNESNLITAVQMPNSSMGLRCVDINVPTLQKVACYIRVSTESPDQEDSYEAQEKYFTKLLVSHPDWKSVGIYSDYGISGTRQETRTGLKRLIRHCEEGKINRIICKSISRFSRNTADTLKIIRKFA